MLLKVYVEDTLPFLQNTKGNTLISWIVNETLPLSHPQQLDAFGTALGLSAEEKQQIDPKTFSLVHGSDTVDTALSPTAALLVTGTVLTMVAKSNTPRTMRQLSVIAAGTPRGGDRSDSPMRGGSKSPRAATAAPSPTKSAGENGENEDGGEDGSHTPRSESRGAYADTAASPSEYPDGDEPLTASGVFDRDEVYVSEDCGWFPFHLNSNYGQLPVATCIDPLQTAKETDRNPPQQQLCPPCSQLLSDCRSLKVPVDRHYKPMSLNFEISEGFVEKLSLGRFSRWQKRYLMLSERSVDWFQDQPAPGDKAKIRGMRHVMRDGVVNIANIIENPDPSEYPKCKDTNYFHFGIVFKHPNTTMFFRVPSLQQRVKYVTFLKQMVTRLSNTGAQKDPVYWKKWSDALLTNLADLGEVTLTNMHEKAELERALEETRLRRQEIKDELPGLQQVLSQQRSSVQALKRELLNIEGNIAGTAKEVSAAEEAIELEKIELGLVEIEIGDELRKAEVLRAYAQTQNNEAADRIEELQGNILELKEKHKALFTRWRKLEEQSTNQAGKKGGPTRMKPTDMMSFSATGIPLSQSVKSLPESWRTPSPQRKQR